MLASRNKIEQTFNLGRFTCITGRCGLVALANFNPHTRTVGLFLLLASRGVQLCRASVRTSVPIHTMQLTKVDGLRLLLTSDYEGTIRVFAVTHNDLVFVKSEKVSRIEEIKITSDTELEVMQRISLIDYLYFKCTNINFYINPKIRIEDEIDYRYDYRHFDLLGGMLRRLPGNFM